MSIAEQYILNRPKLIVSQMNTQQLRALQTALTPKTTKYFYHMPTPKQTAFLLLEGREAFYGGAAGGGKSDALLMAALQYVDVPGYAAIIFRKTFSDLALPGALLDRAREWLAPYKNSGELRWDEKNKTYTFPSGATLTFGYLEHATDKYRYQGAEFQFIGFDEATQIDESSYRYLFSRLRRLRGMLVPLRVRAASNPGGIGHEWVKRRFLLEGPARGRIFIPATLNDNPYLDVEEYVESLGELDLITRAQLLEGNWEVKEGGQLFKRGWFEITDRPPDYLRIVRFWDLAATKPEVGKDPDWTVGVKLGEWRGLYVVLDVRATRARPYDVEQLIKNSTLADGYDVAIGMEQEPGSSGVITIDHYARNVLRGYNFKGIRSTGSKVIRANPASAASEQGRVKLLRGDWNTDFLDQLEMFPFGAHDDHTDGFSGAFNMLRSQPMLDAVPIEVGESDFSYWESVV